jgi:hypothetical protein
MSDFKKLVVWKKAHLLALAAHRVASGIGGLSIRAFAVR